MQFPGKYDDRRAGLGFYYYNWHRWYDPAVGRYTQVDPRFMSHQHPYTWHACGALARLTYGNGAVLTRSQTLDGAPASIAVTDPATAGAYLWQADYGAVDRQGRPLAVSRSGPGLPESSESYTYDSFGRLVNATFDPPLDSGRTDEYRYRHTGPGGSGATLGNRTQQQRLLAGAVQSSDAYALGVNGRLVNESGSFVGQAGSDDRLTLTSSTSAQSGTTAWCDSYDAAGNLVSGGPGLPLITPTTACGAPLAGPCFEHDDWGRVVVAGHTQPDGSCQAFWQYSYDYKGRRVAARGVTPQFANGWHVFHYDQGDRLICEQVFDDQGAVTKSTNYYYLGGELLAMARTQPTAAVYYFHNDHLGTPQRLSQADGTVKWAARYSPFGEIGASDLNAAVDCQQPLLENPHRFPGQYDDRQAGLGFYYYNSHRYFDPASGRYTQADPLVAGGLDGVHPYGYADNNPLVYADESGLFRVDSATKGAYACVDEWARYIAPWIAWNPVLVKSLSQRGRVSPNAVHAAVVYGRGPLIKVGACPNPESPGCRRRAEPNTLYVNVPYAKKCCSDFDYQRIGCTVMHELVHSFRNDLPVGKTWMEPHWPESADIGTHWEVDVGCQPYFGPHSKMYP